MGEFVRQQAAQQKAAAHAQLNQQMRAQENACEQEFQQQLALLQQAAYEQKVALETQASQLIMEYNTRKMQEEMHSRQYELQVKHWEAQQEFNAEMTRHSEEQQRTQAELAAKKKQMLIRQ